MWLTYQLSMREWDCHCGKRKKFLRGLPLLKLFLRCYLCSLGLTLKGIIPAVHVVFLDNLAALNSLLCVFVCGYGFLFATPICLGVWSLWSRSCCELHCSKDVERKRTYSTEAFISHLQDEDISRKIGPDFCVSVFSNEANWLVLLL